MTSAPASSAPARTARRGRYARAGRDTGFLLTQFPLAIAGAVLALLALSLGIPLLIIWIGLAVLGGLLTAVNGIEELTRDRLRSLGHDLPTSYRRIPEPGTSIWRRAWGRIRHGQSWMDVLGAILGLPVAILTFVLAVTWWVTAAGCLLYWFWSRFLPEDGDSGLMVLVGFENPVLEAVGYAVAGVLMLLLAPWVVRLGVLLHVALARFTLLGSRPARLRARIDDLTASRAAVVGAEAQALRRIERNLHDGPQQRLVRTTMDVQAARRRLDAGDADGVRAYLDSAVEQVQSGLAELRTLSRGIAPPVLADRGLHAAIRSLAGQSAIAVEIESGDDTDRRYGLARETAAYFVVSEALANANKHSGAGTVQIRLDTTAAGALRVRVTDDGVGGAHIGKGHGLAGLLDRVTGLDGTLDVVSPASGGTTVLAVIPDAGH